MMNESHWFPLALVICVGLITASVLAFLLRSRYALKLPTDYPNQRSLHTQPIPRIGGIVLIPILFIAWCFLPNAPMLVAYFSAALALLSYFDDRYGLPIWLRLGAQVIAAVGITLALGVDDPWAYAVGIASIVWMTNVFNFMDGADGLAGGMALIGFLVLGSAVAQQANLSLAWPYFAVASGAAGFLLFNHPPAKIFLGDAGSIPLGFIATLLSLEGSRRGIWPLWFPVLVFSPFIVDATTTLIQRSLRKETPWQAHKSHYYQRLIQLISKHPILHKSGEDFAEGWGYTRGPSPLVRNINPIPGATLFGSGLAGLGWSHQCLAWFEYVLMFLVGLTALGLLNASSTAQLIGLGIWAGIYFFLMYAIDVVWRKAALTRQEDARQENR